METLAVGAIVVLLAAVTVINALKGKYGFAFLGLLVAHSLGLVGALRLAKPGSWWARNFYDETKAARALARFSRPDSGPEPTPHPQDSIAEWTPEELAHQDRITRRAMRRR